MSPHWIKAAVYSDKGSVDLSLKGLHFFLGIVSAPPIKFLFGRFCPFSDLPCGIYRRIRVIGPRLVFWYLVDIT